MKTAAEKRHDKRIDILHGALDTADDQIEVLIKRLQKHHGDEREVCKDCVARFVEDNERPVLGSYGDKV